MPKKYSSSALAAIHETMEALHGIGAVDRQTMREFDEACLTPIEAMPPEEIKVSDWERGVKKPGGPALRLLTVIRHKGLMAIA